MHGKIIFEALPTINVPYERMPDQVTHEYEKAGSEVHNAIVSKIPSRFEARKEWNGDIDAFLDWLYTNLPGRVQ